jgi:hypothetical protein
MPVIYDRKIQIDVDDVLRGQGAIPETVRKRSPKLVTIAEKSLIEAQELIKPIVIYKELAVESYAHETLTLSDGSKLTGEYVKKFLHNSTKVIIAACTISEDLQDRVDEIVDNDIVYALALNGAGSSAVEKLATDICDYFEKNAEAEGLTTTVPLNPGMIGWPVEIGQNQIFNILSSESDEIVINQNAIMHPFKSLSFVIGVSPENQEKVTPCDICSLRGSCIYHKHANKEENPQPAE